VRGRFAPSPTGLLHLGNAFAALLGWLHARSLGGEFLLRLEDLDPDRCREDFAAALIADLAWLGLTFDGEVWRQSQRGAAYDAALEALAAKRLVYPCWCSRAEVARAASAPHLGEDGPVYPGTCARGATPKPGRAPALRFRVPPGEVAFDDELQGRVSQDVAREVGDFVVRRMDGVASYQLAVVVDDAAQGITHVLRGADLLGSTPRQLLLYRALGLAEPRFVHTPLLLGEGGQRLAKRERATTLSGLREAGVAPEKVVGQLAKWAGLSDGRPAAPPELVAGFALARLRREPAVATKAELDALLEGPR